MIETIDNLCLAVRQHDASDLFLHEGALPQIRLRGELMNIGETVINQQTINAFWKHVGGGEHDLDCDTSYVASDGGRFRVNLFQYLGQRGAVLRQIKLEIPGLEALHLPASLLTEWVQRPAGLVIVAGRTGSGKSTTLASTLQWLNQHHPRHVVTIEDPIEYLFQNEQSLFTQREVGLDTGSFAEGLRRALRQSPDVILVGEIRDRATAETALHAVETGHLVMTTLHSANVVETLERLQLIFPENERAGVQRLLANLLLGILCQRLVPTTKGTQVPIIETFQNEGVSRKYLMEGRSSEIRDLIERGEHAQNRAFLSSLAEMVRGGVITRETAAEHAENPAELSRALRGISNTSVITTA
ncbi:MAG: PilT/PilU family type 4a pilus ATPase [Verrucomicrobiota bacterium]